MQCVHCKFSNPVGSRFCGQCGSPLSTICPACAFDNPEGFKFCGGCGKALSELTSPTPEPVRVEQEAERRQLTVMFCDLVESTQLAGQLDPEDLRDVTREYQSAASQVLTRFAGHVAQYLGDGLLVYFGYPLAHEDDARRAVHAGLGVLAAMHPLNERLEREKGLRLAVRIGIHTGPVVTGEVGAGKKRERLALGQTPNIAARLQGLAGPDQVVMSHNTYRLVSGFFTCRSLGHKTLKGIDRPIEVFLALAESGVQSRFEVTANAGLNALVGRHTEMELLRDAVRLSSRGQSEVLLISGEAGIGKSRLIEELRQQVTDLGGLFMICRTSPYFRDTAFYPVIGPLTSLFSLSPNDSADRRLTKLEQGLDRFPVDPDEAVPLLASLLAISLGERYALPSSSPRQQKKELLDTLLIILIELARTSHVVLVVEDLHWVDPSTEEFLDLLIRRQLDAPILTVLSFRPSFDPPWSATHIQLRRLTDDQIKAMVGDVTDNRELPPEVLREVIERTDGVPLFVEELTKMVLESGLVRELAGRYELTGPLPPLAIPATLQDSLTARLDRLATTKQVAQLGAVLGRKFTFETILSVTELSEEHLRADLERLVDAGLILQTGEPPESTYLFKHALIQEVAYNSLLKSTRQIFHRRIAEQLLERFPQIVETRPEVLARHFTAAGLYEQAIGYWLAAGKQAIERSANLEAIGHLRRGLEAHDELSEEERHDPRLELDLQNTIAGAYTSIKGWTAPEVRSAYARAQQLCETIGDTPHIFWVLRGLWSFHTMSADWQPALDLGHRLMRLAAAQTESAFQIEAHLAVGMPLFFLGDPTAALEQLDRGLSFDSEERDRSLAFKAGLDVVVTTGAISGVVAWHVGQPEQAQQRCRNGIALARELGHAFSQADASSSSVWLANLLGDRAAVEQQAAELLALSEDKGFHYTAFSNILLGWARVAASGDATHIDRIHHGLAAYRATGASVGEVYFLFLLAESYLRLGNLEAATAALDQADHLVGEAGGRHYWKSEIGRLRGELLLTTGDNQAAAATLKTALKITRLQQSRGLELRAATSLARLYLHEGDQQQAREVLEPVYASFSEGFDTADQRAARSLLESMD